LHVREGVLAPTYETCHLLKKLATENSPVIEYAIDVFFQCQR